MYILCQWPQLFTLHYTCQCHITNAFNISHFGTKQFAGHMPVCFLIYHRKLIFHVVCDIKTCLFNHHTCMHRQWTNNDTCYDILSTKYKMRREFCFEQFYNNNNITLEKVFEYFVSFWQCFYQWSMNVKYCQHK